MADAQLATDLLRVDPPALVGERGIARDHKHAGDPRQIGRQVLGDPVREILLLRVVAEIGKGQHNDRQPRRNGNLGDWRNGRYTRRRQIGDGFAAQGIDAYRPRDVLDALLAEIRERIGQLVADLVAHHPGDADPARRGERFQARRYVHTIAKDVVVLDDDVAEIDPDPETDPAVLGCGGLAVNHRPLQFGRTAHRVDDAREFRQHPVASVLDDPTVMPADLRSTSSLR